MFFASTIIKFQFTHSGKGATQYDLDYDVYDFQFQFTHPGKGATGRRGNGRGATQGFNSRTLGRVRPALVPVLLKLVVFQFTHPGKGATSVMMMDLKTW